MENSFKEENSKSLEAKKKDNNVFSHLDEQVLISKYVNELAIESRTCVDIAASDGVTMSNTYSLFRDGWNGLAVEYDNRKFASLAQTYAAFSGVNLAKCKVTPENAVWLLKANQLPSKIGFFNLDIDGYDYFVLEQILSEFRPQLICVEINEKIPPPIKFSVKWNPDYFWKVDHFYGQSISQLYMLCLRFQYSLVELHYNNAFLIPSESNPYPSLTPEVAYEEGYLNRLDRKEKFPWNADMEVLLSLPPEEAVAFIKQCFSSREGEFTCSL
jgi:hypothetical protein